MTTLDSGAMDQLAVGCPVFSADGDELGHVKEVRGRYFKVDAPMARDYWLSRDVVDAVQGDGVTLAVDKDNLGDVKLGEPNDETDAGGLVAVGAAEPLMDQGQSVPAATAHEGLLTSYPPFTPVAPPEFTTTPAEPANGDAAAAPVESMPATTPPSPQSAHDSRG